MGRPFVPTIADAPLPVNGPPGQEQGLLVVLPYHPAVAVGLRLVREIGCSRQAFPTRNEAGRSRQRDGPKRAPSRAKAAEAGEITAAALVAGVSAGRPGAKLGAVQFAAGVAARD